MTIDALVDPIGQTIQGSFSLLLESQSEQDLGEILMFVYPELYGAEPELSDILAERVHPRGSERASQRIDSLKVRVQGQSSVSADGEFVWIGGVPLLRIVNVGPLPTGTTVELSASFETHVPERYGPFGRVGDVLTINGGLAPLPVQRDPQGNWLIDAPPAPLRRSVHLEIPEDWSGSIGNQLIEPRQQLGSDKQARVVHHQAVGSWTSLSLRKNFRYQVLDEVTGASVTFVGKPLRKLQRAWIARSVNATREVLESLGGEPRGTLLLVEAPLRRHLVERGDGVLFVSDRYLEASPLLWRYFDVHLAQAMLADGVEHVRAQIEEPRFLPLVVHGIGWSLVPDYMRVRWRNHMNLRRLLEGFSFLPYIDNLLETPVFPFADQIYDNPYVADPLRADIRRFNRPLRSGRLLFLRLEDEVGEASLRAAVRDALDPQSPPFPTSLEQRTGRHLLPVFEHWLRTPPRVDYSLDPVERSRDSDGNHRTRVRVRRTTDSLGPVRPVEVRLSAAHRPRKRNIKLFWSEDHKEAQWEIVTPWRVARIEIDPRGRMLELDREGFSLKQNNRRPRPLRVTGNVYILSINPTSGTVEAWAALDLRPRHDHRHRVASILYTNQQVMVGGTLSYTHSFGPPRVGPHRRKRIVVDYTIERLSPLFRPTSAPLLTEAQLSLIYDNRSWSFNPTRGSRLRASLFMGADFGNPDSDRAPGESTFVGLDLEASHLIPLHPWHVLGLRGKLGLVTGNVVHRQFTLGGNNDLRGIAENYLVGPFRTMATVEWRHHFFRGADIPFGLGRFRALQGAVFLEGGLVSNPALGPPDPRTARFSIGYGLRLFGDWLGVLPAMGGIEIAWSPGAPP
ncbi:MAG TPA: hypothetical protein DIU15_09415, partial [Deltaproteobacteria bacterium]|nr:hypothetical protein [Deltaproteobacteria bacterium]